MKVKSKEAFEEYRELIRDRSLVTSELDHLKKNDFVKVVDNTNARSGVRTQKDDTYIGMIERKDRLEAKKEQYDSVINRIDKALEIMDLAMPIECKAVKLRHIECKSMNQVREILKFSRTQCWNYLKRGEEEMERLLEIVS